MEELKEKLLSFAHAADSRDLVKTLIHAVTFIGCQSRRIQELEKSLAELVVRCDGEEGVRADGSNIDTRAQAAVLWPDEEDE